MRWLPRYLWFMDAYTLIHTRTRLSTTCIYTRLQAKLRLDAILTVVDAKHLVQHLDDDKPEGVENEAVEQLAFADRVLLNKIDLVDDAELAAVERRIRVRASLQSSARIQPNVDRD